MTSFFDTLIVENTLGGILITSFFVLLGILIKGHLSNKGTVAVAKINANVSLSDQAFKAISQAMEALRRQNNDLKESIESISREKGELERLVRTLREHMDIITGLILKMLQAETEEESDLAAEEMKVFLKSIDKWSD